MKIILHAKNFAVKENRQQHKLTAVARLLDKHENISTRRFLKKLATCLLLPDSYLISLPTALLSEHITKIFQFLEQNTDEISFQHLPLNDDHCLLLVKTPDAPYIIDAILTLQNRYPASFRLLVHPILTIKRQGGRITYLQHNELSDENELLIAVRLEDAGVDHFALLKHEIGRIAAATLQAWQCRNEILTTLNQIQDIRSLQNWNGLIAWLVNHAFVPYAYQRYRYLGEDKRATGKFWSVDFSLGVKLDLCCGDAGEEAVAQLLTDKVDVCVRSIPMQGSLLGNQPLTFIEFLENKDDGRRLAHTFVGFFDELELSGNACHVPFLFEKIHQTLAAAKVSASSHEYHQLRELFNLFPKIDLFFLRDTQLLILTHALIRYLNQPETIKLLILANTSPAQISALLIIPLAFFKQGVEKVLQQKLTQQLSCKLESSRKIISGVHYVGLHLLLAPQQETTAINVFELERSLNVLARPWEYQFRLLLERALGRERGNRSWKRYQRAFSTDYQALMPPRYAVKDLLKIEQLIHCGKTVIALFAPCRQVKKHHLQFYSADQQYLDEYIPVLENLNLRLVDQVQFTIGIDDATVFIKSFAIQTVAAATYSLTHLKPFILDAVQAILDGQAENDALNGLIVLTGMNWQEVDVLRAYRNYYLQLGLHSTETSFHNALLGNPRVARCLFDYFEVRFRPDSAWDEPECREEQALFPLRLKLLEHLEAVTDINADRILRTLFNIIDATVRSNYHLRRTQDDYFFAFKINSLGIIELPAPRPQNEIYVHAVDMEGIHLRGGKISRGGIRWSDRPDDFRTEILGLMQTQMSKNALIIPKGAKGGFIVKHTGSGATFGEAGKKAYIRLMHGLLDLTDNYQQEQIQQLPDIVTYDGKDPYLVVAADKGTAQFPDIANAVAEEYRFWLRDAFASGGSQGYNHKQLGITARGAWESVKRHFRELGKDIQRKPFTVLGIGSMDGDVFGNGMLLSPYIRLQAAISGQHIFIDPDPIAELSFQERQRLFDLPGSSWDDYQRELISPGGDVFRRDDKNIPLSQEVKKWLGIRYRNLDGESLIRYLLQARVELLWLGGIGTYVKASSEENEQAGDRRNDAVRIDASTIQADVVGEGANLGFTQKARIEFSLAGGRINTDAIDNSAGVDISDHEVNLKILLYALEKNQHVDNYQYLFNAVTEDVCDAVLNNNYAQCQCLSLDLLRCGQNPEAFMKLADRLESAALLDRSVEAFPSAKELLARQGHSLTQPELAVLMAAGKMLLTQLLQEQQILITADYCRHFLHDYFPGRISSEFHQQLLAHPLANEIIATMISNTIINQAGCTFLTLNSEGLEDDIIACVASYLTFDEVLQGGELRKAIAEFDNQISTAIQYRLLLRLDDVLAGFCRWALSNENNLQPGRQTIDRYRDYLQQYENFQVRHSSEENRQTTREQITQLQQDGIPDALAHRITLLTGLVDFPRIVQLTEQSNGDFIRVLTLFNEIGVFLGLNEIVRQLASIPLHDHWEQQAEQDLQENMKRCIGHIVIAMLNSEWETCQDYFTETSKKQALLRYQRVYQEVNNPVSVSFLPYLALEKELIKLGCSE